MAISTAILWIGPGAYSTYVASGYTFPIIPQIGQRDDMARGGADKLGPTNKRRIVTLKGYVTGANLNAVQAKIATLRTALSKENQVLYFHDGVTAQINNMLVAVENVDIPVQWGQYRSEYTVTLSYIPLDDVHKAPAIVSYGTYVFCDLTTNVAKPIPLISKEYKIERQSPDAVRESARNTLTLSGFFEAGSISGNQSAQAALDAALATDDLTLTYGSFSQSVKVLGVNYHEDTMQRRLGYVISFQYVSTARANGVIKLSSSRRITRVTQRYVPHLVPFLDSARVQLLGTGPQKIHATGYVIADSLANAKAAALIEIAAQFPVLATPAELVYAYGATYSGIEDPSSQITEYAEQMRCDWSVEHFFGTPALTGTLYGTGL